MATIGTLLDQHQSGARDHSAALWSLSMIESFLRQVHSAGRVAPAAEAVASPA
jgi:asparagine synthase (glutamine-hydrolysing)